MVQKMIQEGEANTVCIFNQLRGWPISLQLFVCIFYQLYCYIIHLWSRENIQTTPFIIGLLCTNYLQKWGDQNVLLKFCGGHGPPGPAVPTPMLYNIHSYIQSYVHANVMLWYMYVSVHDHFLDSYMVQSTVTAKTGPWPSKYDEWYVILNDKILNVYFFFAKIAKYIKGKALILVGVVIF